MKRIKHNDLTHYFLREHSTLPPAYLRSCEKFFKSLSVKQRAASSKRQAASFKQQALDIMGFYGKKIIESEK